MTSVRPFFKAILVLIAPALFLALLVSIKGAVLRADGKPAFWLGPRAGEAEILGPIKLGIDLLRKNGVADYRLNYGAFGDYQILWEQRTIEGAWPIRFLATSPHVLSFGPMDQPGCRAVDQSDRIFLYVCN
jgi:hypothetical protein